MLILSYRKHGGRKLAFLIAREMCILFGYQSHLYQVQHQVVEQESLGHAGVVEAIIAFVAGAVGQVIKLGLPVTWKGAVAVETWISAKFRMGSKSEV